MWINFIIKFSLSKIGYKTSGYCSQNQANKLKISYYAIVVHMYKWNYSTMSFLLRSTNIKLKLISSIRNIGILMITHLKEALLR